MLPSQSAKAALAKAESRVAVRTLGWSSCASYSSRILTFCQPRLTAQHIQLLSIIIMAPTAPHHDVSNASSARLTAVGASLAAAHFHLVKRATVAEQLAPSDEQKTTLYVILGYVIFISVAWNLWGLKYLLYRALNPEHVAAWVTRGGAC